MFKLKLQDRKGNELKEGDIVKISNGREFAFFAEVRYIEEHGIITPFHIFSFHSFEKVDKVPDDAIPCYDEGYGISIWYIPNAEKDNEAKEYEEYLLSWRQCEHLMEKRCWVIVKD
jgi:hypothetical protein